MTLLHVLLIGLTLTQPAPDKHVLKLATQTDDFERIDLDFRCTIGVES